MSILTILLVLLVVAAFPTWGYSNNWGYGPFGFLVLILLLLIIFGYLR